MNFQEVQGNTKLLLKKSNRDDCMSEKIPKDSGIPNTPSFLYIVGFAPIFCGGEPSIGAILDKLKKQHLLMVLFGTNLV